MPPFALWNTDLPIYRKVNLSFSDIGLLASRRTSMSAGAWPVN